MTTCSTMSIRADLLLIVLFVPVTSDTVRTLQTWFITKLAKLAKHIAGDLLLQYLGLDVFNNYRLTYPLCNVILHNVCVCVCVCVSVYVCVCVLYISAPVDKCMRTVSFVYEQNTSVYNTSTKARICTSSVRSNKVLFTYNP